MPVINGVYTKDFPALGRAPIDTDIIPIAEVANQITYKTTIGAIFNAKVFGTAGRLSKFTTANTLGNSILNEIGNAIHLTNAGSSFASFGIINPGTPGDPGVDNDGYIGSTINNDFTIRVNNVEAARFDTAYRFKITTIQNATTDTDKFLVSDGGIVKYRTGTELRSDIGAGVGSVTSVALTMPVAFSVANSPITSSGSLDVTAVGTAAQYIRGDGQLATLPTGAGGGSAVNYYLNGSIAASVATYKQMSNSAVIGGGTDFNLVGNGLISQFLTDVGNPNRLLIPGGAWNFEMFFSVSSSGGNQKFYIELLKYNGSTFTSIASGSANPEEITGGTTTDLYLTSLAVPETVLLTTDRLAVRVYIVDNSGGRTVTLHTEDNNLCLVTTTFAGGISALNGLTANTQYLAVGTSGTDFNISSLTDTHTFNLPTASATNRGALSSANWTTFNNKQDTITLTTTGSSGAATFIANTLNIPNYGSALSNYVTLNTDQTIGGFKSFSNSVSLLNGTSNALNFEIGTSGNFAGLKAPSSGGSVIITLPSATGTLALTSDIHSAVTLSAIGSTPNANGATLTGQVLNLQPASVSFGGVVTTSDQSFIGSKTFISNNTYFYGNSVAIVNIGRYDTTYASYLTFGTGNNPDWFIGQQSNSTDLTISKGAGGTIILSNALLGTTANFTGQLTLGSTITNGTYTYTLPSATGTLALTSNITSAISGTTNYIPKFTGANTIGNSIIQDDGTNTSIGYTTNPSLYKLDVNGTGRFAGDVTIDKATPLFVLQASDATTFHGIEFRQAAGFDAFIKQHPNTGEFRISNGRSVGWGGYITFYTDTVKRLEIAQTGAATFSSSVTAGATINLPNAFFLTGRNNANTSNIGLIGRNTSDRVIIDADGYGTNIGGGGTVLINPSGGNVGIGNLAIAGYKLDVSGTGRFVGNLTLDSDLTYSSNAGFGIVSQNGTRLVTIQNGAFGVTGAATFSSSVTATAFFESSSIAGKNIIKTNPLTSLDLDVIQYTRKTDESKDVRYGYSAEQIHSLMPELTDKDVTAVKYLDVHTLLIAQLQQEIKELKAKFN
jgi:hypothetical protein